LAYRKWNFIFAPLLKIYSIKIHPKTMNRIISFTFMVAMAGSLSAQITVTNAAFPAAGDTLRVAFDTTSAGIVITPPGGSQSWNFNALTAAFTRTSVVKPAAEGENAAAFPAAALVVEGQNGDSYFRVTSSVYELVGFDGNDPAGLGVPVITAFNPPIQERRAPLNFFDINTTNGALLVPFAANQLPQAILNLLPIVPDSIRIRLNSNRTDLVDGWGTLTIPGGTYDVLRERRIQYSDTRVEIKIGIFPWTDITSLIPLPNVGLGRDTTLTYNFFSNTAKEPIAIVTADHVTGQVLSVEYKFNGIISSSNELPGANKSVIAYPNPTGDRLYLEVNDLPRGEYEFNMFDVAGRSVLRRQVPFQTGAPTEIEVQSIRSGAYFFTITDKGGQIRCSGRIVKQ